MVNPCTCVNFSFFQTPSTEAEWLQVSHDFHRKWNFPHVIGCIDGKHIRIVCPRKGGSLYYNYKDFHSIVLLGICNANYEFIYVHVGCEGRCSDGGIWSQTKLQNLFEDDSNPMGLPTSCHFEGINNPLPFFLVGDDAFKLCPYLLKPYWGYNLTHVQRIFNYRLSRCRRLIENVFGIMSTRFTLLQRAIEVSPDRAQNIVMACCVLHNFLRKCSSGYLAGTSVDQELGDGSIVGGDWRQDRLALVPINIDQNRNPSLFAKEIRNKLADYFVTPQGELHWQYDRVYL